MSQSSRVLNARDPVRLAAPTLGIRPFACQFLRCMNYRPISVRPLQSPGDKRCQPSKQC